MGPVLNEVVRPDMIGPTGPEANAGAIIKPEPTPFRLFLWHFQPLTSPDAFHSANPDLPPLHNKQSPDPTIPVTAIFGCQGDNRLCQGILVRSANGKFALCRSMLTENLAGTSLRDSKFLADMINTSTATCGA